jgi:hypothetical protein
MRETIDQAREVDRQLDAATDPAEMKALIARRRMIRARMSLEFAVMEHERVNRPASEPFRLFGRLR